MAAWTGIAPPARFSILIRAVTRPFPGAFSDVNRGGQISRLMVWWGESRLAQTLPLPPGAIAKLNPLTVACGDGLRLEITDFEWVNNDNPSTPARSRHPFMKAKI